VEVVVDAERPPVDILAAIEGVEDVQVFGDRAHVRLTGGSQSEAATRITNMLRAKGITVQSARPVSATLEDVFIGLIADGSGKVETGPTSGLHA
jgi:hypothetical protein